MKSSDLIDLTARLPPEAWPPNAWVEGEDADKAAALFEQSAMRWLCARLPLITINVLRDGSGQWAVGIGTKGEVRWAKTLLEALVLLVELVVRKEAKASADGKAT